MLSINSDVLQTHRAQTFRTAPGLRLHSAEEAVEYVNQRGFIYFWPIKGILLPSLWVAAAGDRPVPDAHDDPGHITWDWKDSMLGQRRWYYAKLLRKRATIISLELAPYFYALSENYGAPEEDYLTIYEQGRLTLEAKLVYEALLDHGPLDTVALRKAAHLTSRESESRFNKALADLQADFKILPIGVTDSGAWHYAFAYAVTARYFPELAEQARKISERQAYDQLALTYLCSVGATRPSDLVKLFGWRLPTAEASLSRLEQAGQARRGYSLPHQHGEYFIVPELA